MYLEDILGIAIREALEMPFLKDDGEENNKLAASVAIEEHAVMAINHASAVFLIRHAASIHGKKRAKKISMAQIA